MNINSTLEIFIAICAGVGALKVVISSVKNCIKQEMAPIIPRLARLEKDGETLSAIENKVFSKETLKDIIDKKILEHQKECPKK